MSLKNILNKFASSYLFVLSVSLLVSLLFPTQTVKLASFSTLFLGSIFFLSALKIDLRETLGYFKDKAMFVVVILVMLILLPIAVYFVTLSLVPNLAIAFLLLAVMPCGMTAPLLSEICGGKQSLALVLTISTSLLAPFTVPIVIKVLAGANVDVSMYDMFVSLAKVIFIPFILANIVKYFWYKKIQPAYKSFKSISTVLLGLLIVSVVSQQADVIIGGLQGKFLFYLFLTFVFFIIVHFLGYFVVFWRDKKDRITITICISYMNFTLAIYLAGKFFVDPNIVIPVILSVLPWSILLIPFKFIIRKLKLVN
ncbi:MAG: bile acid:sodium symporter [Candidatus Magasanikbacteria bacterium]|nr:bile acid:sodium symporter [Candidatus Magasanikbacteria bacterium]